MPTGGFKILDTAEVKMAFSAYTQYLTNNHFHALSTAECRADAAKLTSHAWNNGAPAKNAASSGSNNASWFSKTFSSSSSRCAAIVQNEARPGERQNFNQTFITSVQLVGPTQVVPATFMNAPVPRTAPPTPTTASEAAADELPPKFDPDLICCTRTHRITREACVLAECSSVNPPAREMQQQQQQQQQGSAPPTARLRDCETLTLTNPACVTLALYNNVCTLFAFVDPASSDPIAARAKAKGDDADFVPLQSIKFATRCTAFATFTTHADYSAAHGLCAAGVDTGRAGGPARGPFAPAELWSVFGFGSGDIAVWSHAQETMLKRHNNTATLTRDAASSSSPPASSSPASGNSTRLCFVEPGVAVSAIARVERGHTERPTCVQWAKAAATADVDRLAESTRSGISVASAASTSSTSASSSRFNTQTQTFADVVVGYENGTILVVSLNASGGFVNHKLCGWFGFNAIRCIKPCPVAPSVLAVGCDSGAVRFLQFPWSFDAAFFEARFQNAKESELSIADIGTAKDPRVLCCIPGAVSGGGATSVNWSCNGEAVVCTGEDDAVSVVSIDCSPPLAEFQEAQLAALQSGGASASPSVDKTTTKPMRRDTARAQDPLAIEALSIHRRNFNKSWVPSNMVLSLDVIDFPGAAGSNDSKVAQLRKVTGVYTASLDGVVVAGAAFPASDLKGPRRATVSTSGNAGGNAMMPATMERHNSIASAVAAAAAERRKEQGASAGTASEGLGIRNRPLARFLQMARADMVVGFASLGAYHAESCACCRVGTTTTTTTAGGGAAVVEHAPQRRRAFVSVTAKGTIALWTFYDILLEEEEAGDKKEGEQKS